MSKAIDIKAGAGDKVFRAEGTAIVEDKVIGVTVEQTFENGTVRTNKTYMLESDRMKAAQEHEFYLSPDEIAAEIQKNLTAFKSAKTEAVEKPAGKKFDEATEKLKA